MKTKNRTIFITDTDMRKLRSLIDALQSSREDLRMLKAELDVAKVVNPSELPSDVITMHSKAQLRDITEGDQMTFTLVFPGEVDVNDGKISVLAPVGTAMLGRRVGDEFAWAVPAGRIHLRVEQVLYQPEAAGHFHL